MRMPVVLLTSTVAAAIAGGCAGLRPGTAGGAARVPWTLESGWLAAPGVCGPAAGPALNLQIADQGDLLPRTGVAPDAVNTAPDGTREVCYRRPLGTLVDVYRPFPELGPDAWQRAVRYTNTTTVRQDLTGLDLWLAPTPVPDGMAWRPWTFRMREVHGGRTLCTAYWASVEPAALSDTAATVQVHVGVGWRLEPGQSAEIGHQGIWLGQAGTEACRREARRWYAVHGFDQPVRYPPWLRQTILYELSAAGHIDSRFSDVGGFDALAHQVPYLADLGVSAVWLNAVQQHKTPPDALRGGWNHYDPRDFLSVDPILGGPERFAALLSIFHANEIHVLSEIVPHGGRSLQAERLPQWWSREREGTLRRNWGGYGMDNASPEWQAVLRDSMALLAGLGGVEGARIDVAEGQGANWGSPRTPRASFSGLAASLEMLEAVRDGLQSGGCKRPVLIPESGDHPAFFAIPGAAVVGYGWGLTNLLAQTPDRVLTDGAELSRRLHADFAENHGALPPGALVLRTLNNHDTVCDKGRVQQRFGAGLHQALYGVCLSVPGIPMLYQEEEVGAYQALRRLNWARRALPWLTDGDAEYLPPGFFDARAFAVWRSFGDLRALCLVNLSGQSLTAAAVLPPSNGSGRRLRLTDAVSGLTAQTTPDGRFVWTLAPYATAFLRVGRGPRLTPPPPERFAGEAGEARLPQDPRGVGATRLEPAVRTGTAGASAVPGDTAGGRGKPEAATPLQNPTGTADTGLEPAVRTGTAGASAVPGDTANRPGTGSASRAPENEHDTLRAVLTPAEGTFVARQGGLTLSFSVGAATAWQERDLGEGRSEWLSPLGVVRLTRRENALDIRCELSRGSAATPPVIVRVEGADRWGVSGRTAQLEDRFVRRHFPFPESTGYHWDRTQGWGSDVWGSLYHGVAPSGRLWQSLLEPLHPDQPAFGFCDVQGHGFILSQVQTDAMNTLLTDATDEGTVPPLRLETRFLAVDADLAPDVQRFGPRPVWTGQALPSLAPRPLTVAFTLRPTRAGLAQALQAGRLPRQAAATTETRTGDRFAEMGGRVFVISPGRIAWSDLPAADAVCQLELELRLSERSGEDTDLADAYRVAVDGVAQPLTWGRKNVWSTGNAYFALARTPPIDLRSKLHTLTVETLRPWCALRPRFALVTSPADGGPADSGPADSGKK